MLRLSSVNRFSTRARPILAVALVVFLLAAAGVKLSSRGPSHGSARDVPPDHGPLNVALSSLDLGEVWETKSHSCALVLRNESTAPVEVVDWRISCNCSSISPRQLTIPAGKTAQVELKVDLTHRLPQEMGVARRQFTVGIAPILNDSVVRQSGWVVHGVVKSRVTLDEDFLQFGELPIDDKRAATRRVKATVHLPAERLEVRVEPDVVRASVERRGPNQFELTFSPDPNLTPGKEFRADAAIDLITTGGERLAGVALPLAGVMPPEVRLLPARVFLGSHPVGTTASAVVVVQAPKGATIQVERIESDSDDVLAKATEAERISPGRAFRITQSVRREGDRISTLRFFVRRDGKGASEVQIEVVYRGEARNWVGGTPEGGKQ